MRVIPTRRLSAETLRGIRVLLKVDAEANSFAIAEFDKAGGVVVNPPGNWRFPRMEGAQFLLTRKQADQLQDLWELVYNVTLRKNFGTRTFKTSGMLAAGFRDANTAVVHLLNYTDYPIEQVTAQALGRWERAALYSPDGPPKEIAVYPVADGTGADVEKISVLATVKFE